MNRAILFIIAFLAVCVTICFYGSFIFESVYGIKFVVYTPYYSSTQDSPTELAFLQILSNTIVLSYFIPISLNVSVEVIRLWLSLFINVDLKMYYPPEDIPAMARTTALNEELGQIEYIFSDKTGTLTQNVMTFLKCSINGIKYGETTSDDKDKPEKVNFKSWNSYADEDFVYYDSEFVEKCRRGEEDCAEFWKLLALCHTVLPTTESGKLEYNAQSPDEAALVAAAKNFGFVFKDRDPFTTTVDNLSTGKEEVYEVLNILDFNNERKRMSVIVEYDNKITLYCKGADSVIFARLKSGHEEIKRITMTHLNDFASEGLRTLVLAKKELSPEEYATWNMDYQMACLHQEGRDQKVDIVYNKIEQNLSLIGATAIEDKLQDGVPETIANLAKANIKIWVLTGDKQETAINIGYSCRLLTADMKVFIVDGDSWDGVAAQLKEADEAIENTLKKLDLHSVRSKERKPAENLAEVDADIPLNETTNEPLFGIIVDGHSLIYGLKKSLKWKFLETVSKCSAVICCRVTPLQKKRVVDLVRKKKNAVTLAIGDGANDVGMIKAAHIGVGISGHEGQQAVLSCDYSIAQFRYLERLLLVHGRWSYHRLTTFLRYFFYKNFAFGFTQLIFAFFCGFTAQTLYDSTYFAIYNVMYTTFPVLALGIMDQDVDENNCYRYPRLYIAGQKNLEFNAPIFVRSIIKGIYMALVIFFVLFGMVAFNVYPGGYPWDYQSYGLAASGALTIIVNLQIALDTSSWTVIMHACVWLSIASWFIVIPITGTAAFYGTFFQFVGVANQVLSTTIFWFYLPLSAVISLLPTMVFRLVKLYRRPTFADFVRLKQLPEGGKSRVFRHLKFKRKVKTLGEGVKELRSSYAFSHQQGFAPLITTGLIFGMNPEDVRKEHLRRQSFVGTLSRVKDAKLPVKSSTSMPVIVQVEVHPPVTAVDTVYAGDNRKDKVAVVNDDRCEGSAREGTVIRSVEHRLRSQATRWT